MFFGRLSLDQAEGALLAHKHKLPSGLLRKGHVLLKEDIERLRAAGYESIVVARLEVGDVHEDAAANAIAAALHHETISSEPAATGRVNLYAASTGLLCIDRNGLDSLNNIDESITLATRPPYDTVRAGDLVATIKIIPYAVQQSIMDTCLQTIAGYPALLRIAPFREKRIALIQTRMPDTKESLLDKTSKVLGKRLQDLGSSIVEEQRCIHDEQALTEIMQSVLKQDMDMLMVIGASAIVDRRDTIPAAITNNGGEVMHFGMPAEPGNLMLLAEHNHRTVLGLPGCARSPARNGLDIILERLLADLPVTPTDLMQMGAGGLLKSTLNRE